MAQFHSLPVSEPVAQICGFLAGLSCYGFFSLLGAEHDIASRSRGASFRP